MDILLVEDNENIISGLEYAFSKNNYNLVSKTNIKSAVEYLNVENIELVINGHMALELSIQALGLQGEIITTPSMLQMWLANQPHLSLSCCRQSEHHSLTQSV